MADPTWVPCWIRGGPIEEIIWISKDVLAWTSGVHIVFLEIAHKKQFIKRCIDASTADGACCLSAHTTFPCFAFSEKIIRPKIFVLAYPSMSKIAECVGGCKSGYLATAFTANDYLVSMGSYPKFPMALWSWRTGEKIIEIDTNIRDDVGQILKTNPAGPILIAQLGKTCGELVVWTVNIINKLTILKDYEIKLPQNLPISWMEWCPLGGDPLLAITDQNGDVYLSNEDGTNVYRIILSLHCNVCTDRKTSSVCWYRDGIVLRTTFCQICYYKKSSKDNVWSKEWSIKSKTKHRLLVNHPFRENWLFYYTYEGYLMRIKCVDHQTAPIVTEFFHYGGNYRFVDFVYPWCHHVVACDDPKDLMLLDANSGLEIARISPDTIGNVSSQTSHPDCPLIILTTREGEVLMVSIANPEKPEIIVHKRLYDRPLDFARLSPSGRFVIVGHKHSGDCFCISLYDNLYTVTTRVRLRRKITDLLLYEIRGGVRILALQIESTRHHVGQEFVIYDVSRQQVLVEENVGTLRLHAPFRNIHRVPGSSQLLVGSPYLTKQLHVLKLLDLEDFEIMDATQTHHQLRGANIFSDRHWLTTTALDGLVIVRNKSITGIITTMLSHHRMDHGSLKGVVHPGARLAIVLGHDGSLVGMKKTDDEQQDLAKKLFHVDHSTYAQQNESIHADYAALNPSITNLLTPTEPGMNKFDGVKDLTWVDWIAKKKFEREEKSCVKERAKILKDFLKLKSTVVDMLDKNEALPEEEKLPIQEFDLDWTAREHAMKAAKDQREDKRLELEYNCQCMDNVAHWLKQTFWDSQKILARSIFRIAGSLEVTNFPIFDEDPDFQEALELAEFQRDLLLGITKSKVTFQSWRIYRESQLHLALEDPLKLSREDERFRMDELLQEEGEIDQAELEEQRAFEGMTTYRFIEPSTHYYSQMESYGFLQVIRNNYFLMDDCRKLRYYFNKVFNELYESKECEMNGIKDKIGRLRYINSELKIMFGRSMPCLFSEPIWHIKEKPENIVQVFEHEIQARPYISPSQEEMLNKQAMEAERIRLLLLADDFRERALMAMMDGVLEVRWEDVIKRDIPKPECMLKKQPEDYTADDIRSVKQYQKEVEQLMQDRERYKRILEADYVKVEHYLKDSVDRFDEKVDELFLMKMKVESGLKQMELRHVRGCIRNNTRVKNVEKYEKMKDTITTNQHSEQTLKKELDSLESARKDLLAPLETMLNREITLMKKFRSEFPSLGRASADLLERQYKRRPRINLKNLRAMDLLNLGKCVMSRTKMIHLPVICVDYLKSVEELDVRPNTLPPSIEEHHWQHLIKIRRQRIELELKIKSLQAEIEQAADTVKIHASRLTRNQGRTRELKTSLRKMQENRRLFDLNTEIQLVMRLGQVEIDLKGRYDDTMNAVLIAKKVVVEANELISAAGAKKIKAMKHVVEFRKNVQDKEWEHKTLKMRIVDLQEDLRFVKGTNVTRDVQIYLKRRAKGLREDKTAQILEKELDTMQNHFAKVLNEWAGRLRDVSKKTEATKRKNDFLDRMIVSMNVVRCEMEHGRDLIAEERQRRYTERKIRMIMKRSDLIRQLQDNYAELLALQTEHELLRLRRYPALKFFRRIDEDPEYDKRKPPC